jgi:D-alanyl-D-alanine carboxypeptidase
MLWIRTEARGGLRWGVFGVISVAAFLTQSALPAAAAPYSDIVVDANSGETLHQTNPDATRHPASLTKIMTLYLLFEQLEAGKIKLDSRLKVSEFASEQSPTKLGLKSGSTIEVEDAIKAIVTRSANDISVVVAEGIAGSEEAFAAMMTRKARALGMSHTVYKNASGLPNDQQVTTARDQSILGRAIQERFPKYYKYFQTRTFTFRGRSIRNHNNLLGRVEGVDGIKTGYIRASGFNLVTSLHRGNRYVVAVVMGGSSAGSRDARMRELINKTIKTASTKRTAPMVAERMDKSEPKVAAKIESKIEARVEPKVATKVEPKAEAKAEAKVAAAMERKAASKINGKDQQRFAVASASSTRVRLAGPPTARIAPGSSEPIRPVPVKTVSVKPGTLQPVEKPSQGFAPVPATASVPAATPAPAKSDTPKSDTPKVETAKAVEVAKADETPKVEIAKIAPPASAEPPQPRPAPVATAKTVPMPMPTPAATRAAAAVPPPAKSIVRSGWMIQVGAFTAEQEAKQRLSTIQSKASKVVDGTDPFTESVEKGGNTFYRARFAGFDRNKAEAACKVLKRDGVECVTIKN